jgi:hypothetical protein
MAAAMWACHLAGCIYTPVNATLPALSKVWIKKPLEDHI